MSIKIKKGKQDVQRVKCVGVWVFGCAWHFGHEARRASGVGRLKTCSSTMRRTNLARQPDGSGMTDWWIHRWIDWWIDWWIRNCLDAEMWWRRMELLVNLRRLGGGAISTRPIRLLDSFPFFLAQAQPTWQIPVNFTLTLIIFASRDGHSRNGSSVPMHDLLT